MVLKRYISALSYSLKNLQCNNENLVEFWHCLNNLSWSFISCQPEKNFRLTNNRKALKNGGIWVTKRSVFSLWDLLCFLKSNPSRNWISYFLCIVSSVQSYSNTGFIFILWYNHWIQEQSGDCSTADRNTSQWNSCSFQIDSKEKSCLVPSAALQPVGFQKFL